MLSAEAADEGLVRFELTEILHAGCKRLALEKALSEQHEFVRNGGNAPTRDRPFRPQERATPPTRPSVFACRVRD
jgi:hypothetical protein